jgi:hypothetical protein
MGRVPDYLVPTLLHRWRQKRLVSVICSPLRGMSVRFRNDIPSNAKGSPFVDNGAGIADGYQFDAISEHAVDCIGFWRPVIDD